MLNITERCVYSISNILINDMLVCGYCYAALEVRRIMKIKTLSEVRVSMGKIYLKGRPCRIVGHESDYVECIAKQRHKQVVALRTQNDQSIFIGIEEAELVEIPETIH